MRFFRKSSFILMFLLFVQHTFACDFAVDKSSEVKTEDGNYRYQVVFNSTDGEIPTSEKLEAYRSFVRENADVDPLVLLRRQREIYTKVFPEAAKKFDQIIGGKVGKIRPINCIEQALLVTHLNYFSADTEYGAFVFTKPLINKIVVLVKSSKEAGVNFDDVLVQVGPLIESGWILSGQIHNHPFVIGNESGDIGGTVIPSDPDTDFFKKLLNAVAIRLYHQRI